MLINNTSTVTNNTGMLANKFTMQASGAAFKIISSSLYERKEEAVLRELSANAYDAQREVGKEATPIQITLPSELNPFLVVTDFGVGMSLSTVENVLTTYFASTKTDSNDDIGGFGLGFKSPFAISDSYTVKTIHNSIHTEVIISLDNGEPTYIIVCNKPTIEPDGTTITVPVDKQSIRDAIYSSSSHLFTYWKTLPIIDGKQAEAVKRTPLYDTPHFTVTDQSYWRRSDVPSVFPKVLVGEFVYSIPSLLLKSITESLNTHHKSEVDYFLKNAVHKQIVIMNTDIGELEIAPSRERIEDTDKNKQLLESKIIDIVKKCNKGLAVYAKKAIDIIYDIIKPVQVAKYGFPASVSIALETKLLKELGINLKESKLLKGSITKNMELDKETLYKLNFIHSITGNLDGYEFTEFLLNGHHKSFLNYIRHSSYLKGVHVDGNRVTRIINYHLLSKLKSKDAAYTLYILTGELSTAKKSRINKTLINSIDKSITFTKDGIEHTLNNNNYLELADETDSEEFKNSEEFKKNMAYYVDNINIEYITFEDIKNYLEVPTKRVNTRTTAAKRPKDYDIVVSTDVRDYSEDTVLRKSVTVGELYKDNIYKGYKVVFLVTSKYNYYFKERNILAASLHKQKIVLIEIPNKETTTVRYKTFAKSNNVWLLSELHTFKSVYELIFQNDVVDAFYVANSLINIFIRDSSFYPAKYKKIIDKYGIEAIEILQSQPTNFSPVEHYKSPEDNGSKEYKTYKLLRHVHSTPPTQCIMELLPKSLVKSAITLNLTIYKEKKE